MENLMTETKAELEVLRAKDLHQRILDSGARAADAYCEMCRSLKMMRDGGYYTHLGYESFEDYTVNALGFKTRQAYNYIQQYENLGEPFLQSNAKLGVTKLSLLVSIPAFEREEFVEKNDIAGMTVAEVKRLVAENDRKGEQLTLLSDQIADKDAVIVDKTKSLTAAEKTISELTEQLEAERSKPVEAVPDNSEEIKKLKRQVEKLDKENKSKEAERRSLQARLDDTGNALMKTASELKDANKKLKELANKESEVMKEKVEVEIQVPVADPKELFRIYYKNAVTAFNTMLEFIGTQPDSDFYIGKATAMISLLNDKLKMLYEEEK